VRRTSRQFDFTPPGVASLLVAHHQESTAMLVVVTHSAALADRFSRRYS
jgi:predicted ABC-type transport system involved in lysophospholipase L1 biosynthesis ATPase subunit